MTTLENRRLRGDMIETWKILNGREFTGFTGSRLSSDNDDLMWKKAT